MIPGQRFLLLWAAAPALVLGVWLLHMAGAPLALQTLQVVTAVVATAVCVALIRASSSGNVSWLAPLLTLSLFIPLLASSSSSHSGPQRWLVMGSTRLYIAPVVLPVALFYLGAPLPAPAIHTASVMFAGTALVFQPDASQVSAFAMAMLVLLITADAYPLLRTSLGIALLCFTLTAWRRPDPLAPVRYVEGVFNLAAEESRLALLLAVVFAALPVLAFVRVSRVTGDRGALAVAVYYASLFLLAPLQVTPVPLLGFGTGPVLGYFLAAAVASRSRLEAGAKVQVGGLRK